MMDAFSPPYSTGQGIVSQRRFASFLLNFRPNSDCCSDPSSVSESNPPKADQPGGSSFFKNSRTSVRNASSSAVNLNSIAPPVRSPPMARLKPGLHRCVRSCRLQLPALEAAGDIGEHLVVLRPHQGERSAIAGGEDERGHPSQAGVAGPRNLLPHPLGVAAAGQRRPQPIRVQAALPRQATEHVLIADVLALLPVGGENGAVKLRQGGAPPCQPRGPGG